MKKLTPKKGEGKGPIAVAVKDERNLKAGFHRVTYGKHELGR